MAMFLDTAQTDFLDRARKYPKHGEVPMPAWGDPSFVVHRVVPTCQQILGEGQKWPESTSLACLWCEEGFSWAPVGAPVGHNAKKDQFILKWNFCSFNCCKAWMVRHCPLQVSNVFWLAMRLFGKDSKHKQRLEGIQPAPQKEALQKYGGWMTVDEFRSNNQLIRPAGTHGINIRWDPVQLSVQSSAAEELATQSRSAPPLQRLPAKPPASLSKPAAKPNTLDTFIRGNQQKQKKPALPVAPAPKRSRKSQPQPI